jgi:single-stranded-DNA-specific exonuclease
LNYRWKFKQRYDDETVHNLAKSQRIPKSLAKVLVSRGLANESEVENFFNPSMSDIHDPYLMDGMDKAVVRILEAVDKKELIWVHGDYDVDGTASTALVCQFIKEIGGNIEYFIPDRFKDGYGLSEKSIQLGLDKGAKILLTVDVGITSYEPLDYAKDKDIDTIICDHHEPGDELPDVYTILDPLKPNCKYPFKYLAACGVAFKLIQAIAIKLGDEKLAFKYLDFVAIASVADMVPLNGENRSLVFYGLNLLNTKMRPGLKGLMYCTGLKRGSMTASNIVYAVAPLINAAGRLGDAKRSVEMMMQDDENAAFRIAQELEEENRKRRLYDRQTFEDAIPYAKKQIKEEKSRGLVLFKPNWHAGVIGIVASRLVDKFNMPTVLMTSIDGLAKGSARSVNNFDIHSALKQCEDLLVEFGGHKHAAGLSLEIDNIPEFRRRFNEIADKSISKDMLVPEIEIDAELELNELSPKFLETLDRFAPYGFANYKPVFYSKGVKSVNGIKIVGNNTLKFRAIQNNFVIDALGQNLAHKISICNRGKSFRIVYNLEMNNFNGQSSPQLNIKDIQPD